MKKFSVLFIAIAGCLWGTMGIFVRALPLSSMELVSLRAFVTAIVMLIFLFIYDKKLLRIRLRDVWCFVGTGVFSILFFSYCYFTTISLTSLALAAILLYTAPAMVMIMSIFLFGEKASVKKFVSVIMAFIGCILVTGVSGVMNTNISTRTILIGLGAGFGYALYSIFGRFALKRGYNALTVLLYTFVFAAFGSVFFCDISHMTTVVTGDIGTILLSLVFVVVTTVLPYFLYTFGLEYTENSKASVIASIEPVVAAFLGIAIYGEALSFLGVLGAVLVLLSALICNINFDKIRRK